ncbi:hypothetical protein L208DRAFT_1325606, partial [Tricholoma matsutake]
KAFQLCCIQEWNLSYKCLTSFTARERLRKMKEIDPEFWKELTTAKTPELPAKHVKLPEDKLDEDEDATDDSELPLSVVIKAITDGQCPEGFAVCPAGGLMSVVDAERLDIDVEDPKELTENVETTELGRGK